MVKWTKRVLLVISILAVLAGTVYALDWLGVFKVQKLLTKIPGGTKLTGLVNKEPAAPKTGKTPDPDSKLQEENRQLKAQIANLQKQLAALKSEKESMVQKQSELEQKLLSQADTGGKVAGQNNTGPESSFKQLAKYYAEMKPKQAVAIMDKLDDETVIGILINLENDQTAKILATMDPKRAARLVNKLTM